MKIHRGIKPADLLNFFWIRKKIIKEAFPFDIFFKCELAFSEVLESVLAVARNFHSVGVSTVGNYVFIFLL